MNRALLGSIDLKLVYSYAITAFFYLCLVKKMKMNVKNFWSESPEVAVGLFLIRYK